MPDIIVFHTAWMAYYDGDRASLYAGGFKYPKKNGYGHEMFNFRDIDGSYYGYVPPTGDLNFAKHFDVSSEAEKLHGVTVVWTAPHPELGGRAVVGVWRNATVFRESQDSNGAIARRRRVGPGDVAGYRCIAKVRNCDFLQPDSRPLFVRPKQPRKRGSWPGQSNVFYPKPGSAALWRLKEIIADIGVSAQSKGRQAVRKVKPVRSTWQADVERRRRIETAAIKAVGAELEARGYTIKSVEKDNLGYDLVATRASVTLHIEVKGRSGGEVRADLSANEFDCLKEYESARNPSAHYRIAIVTDALVNPVIREFILFRGSASKRRVKGRKSRRLTRVWKTLDGSLCLKFNEQTAARLVAEHI